MKALGLAMALFVASAALARADTPVPAPDPTATPTFQIESGGGWSNLTNGYGEWHNVYGSAQWKAYRQAAYGTFTQATRNGVTDSIYSGGIVFPPSSQTILTLEGGFSSTHIFSPSSSVAASLDHRLAAGWGYQIGARYIDYPTLNANIESLGVDRYFGHYYVAYQGSLVQLSNVGGVAVDQRLGFTRYYGPDDEQATTFVISGGRDVENVNGVVAVYPLFELDLGGHNWLGPRLGLVYDLFTLRQGTLYHQTGLQIGIRERT